MASPARIIGTSPDSGSLEEHLQRRAYELYLQRGDQPGTDLDDWLEAEAELAAGYETSEA